MTDLSIKQKKEWAQQLYCQGDFTQKAIADKVGVSEKTLSKWAKDDNWDKLRKSLLISKQEQLAMMYDQLSEINAAIRKKPEGERYADSKEADIMVKITSAIEQLEEETNVTDVFEVGKRFISFLQQHDFEKSKEVVDLYDAFIKEVLKQS
jgi:transcriptional regulator with XRE-family HTH domain